MDDVPNVHNLEEAKLDDLFSEPFENYLEVNETDISIHTKKN